MKDEMTVTGPWPEFATLPEGVTFPLWLREGADQIAAKYGDEIRCFSVEFWADTIYDDNHSLSVKAAFGISWNDPGDRPSEYDLDEIPAMRRLERLAVDLWTHLPLDCDTDGSILGESSLILSRDGISYSWTQDGMSDADFIIDAVWKGEAGWEYQERLILIEPDITESCRASGDVQMILEVLDPKTAGFSAWPKAISFSFSEDDLEVLFEPGSFRIHTPTNA